MAARRPAAAPWHTAAEPELPLLHRLAIVYLMLPVVVWLVGWFEWWLGLPAAALVVGALRRPLSGPWRLRAPSAADVAALAVAAGVVMTTAAGGLFDFSNPDWPEHRTTLLDLGRHPWPAYLPDPLAAWRPSAEAAPATPPLLRYYLGWYMVPGLAAHWFGPAALHWAVPLWTWAGVALVALLFTRGRRGRRLHGGGAVAVALVVLFFFSGMDLVRVPALKSWEWVGYTEPDGRHAFVYRAEGLFKLNSMMRALLWTPQHFLAAGLYTLLCLHLCRRPRFLAVLGVLLAAAPFWSAFVAVGLLPLLAVVVWVNGVRPLLRWPNLCLAGPLFAVVALYLTSGALEFAQGWMWEREGYDWPRLALKLPWFYLTEFLLLALLLVVVRPGLRREPFFLVAVATLLLLPVYWYGRWNDLLTRVSLPALFVLGWLCAGTLARAGRLMRRRGRRRAAFAGLVFVLGVGAVTPVTDDLARSFLDYGPFRYEHAGYTTLVDLPPLWRHQNVARDVPDLLRRLLREPDPGTVRAYRTPGELLVRSDFDVYLDRGAVIYVKDRCTPADVDHRKTFLFLRVIPADPAHLPQRRRRFGSVPYWPRNLAPRPSKMLGGRCLFGASLPEYPVARIVVGQRERAVKPEERRLLWQAEVAFPADTVP